MKIKTSSFAAVAAVLLMSCLVFMAPVGAGYVTVGDDATQYSNLTEAVNSIGTLPTELTLNIYGEITLDRGILFTAVNTLTISGKTDDATIIMNNRVEHVAKAAVATQNSEKPYCNPYTVNDQPTGITIAAAAGNTVATGSEIVINDLKIVNNKDDSIYRSGHDWRSADYIYANAETTIYNNVFFDGGVYITHHGEFYGCTFTEDDDLRFCLFLDNQYSNEGDTRNYVVEGCTFSPEATACGGIKVANGNGDTDNDVGSVSLCVSDCTFNEVPNNDQWPGSAQPAVIHVDIYVEATIENNIFNNCPVASFAGKIGSTINDVDATNVEAVEAEIEQSNPTPLPPSQPTSSSSSGTPTPGAYYNYPRTVTDGGLVEFGTSKVVKSVTLPAGSSGKVNLHIDSTAYWPLAVDSEFTFDISVEKLGEGTSYISFKIAESKLTALDITAADVGVYHNVNGEWVKLTVTYKIEDGDVIYTAETDSFSPFKLVIETGAATPTDEAVTPFEPVTPPTEEPTDVPQDIPGEELPDIPDVQDEPETPASPAPVLGILAALGAAVVLRRK